MASPRGVFPIDVAVLVEEGSRGDPEALFRAVEKQVEPPAAFLASKGCRVDLERLKWMMIELASNALAAPLGTRLAEETGLRRNQLLEAFGTSVLWPHPAREEPPGPGYELVDGKLCSATGCGLAEFLRLPLRDKFRVLEIPLDQSWLRVLVHCPEGSRDFELVLESDFACGGDDEKEILGRLAEPGAWQAKISSSRERHVDDRGVYHLPSFTGGGGLGLIACKKLSGKLGLHFDYLGERDRGRGTRFRIASFTMPGRDK